MSELIEIKIPDLGGADEVEIVEIMVQSGDAVEKEQTLAVMESDKATMDLPANEAGIIQEVIFKVGDKVSQGTLVAMLLPSEAGAVTEVKETTQIEKPAVAEIKQEVAKPIEPPMVKSVEITQGKAHATPSIRAFARELGVDLSQLPQGTGRKGRILREDLVAYVKKALVTGGAQKGGAGIPAIPEVDFTQFGEIDIKPMSKIKRLTGQHMMRICLNLPMVTQHDEADVSEMEAFRKSHNGTKPDIKLTGLVFIIKALTMALKQYPQFNSSLSADGESLVYKKYFNIGIAVETPNGLVVPVIHGADKMSLNQLSEALTELSGQAREGKLPPAAMQGGTMTISSLGGIGGTAFTPIVNAPEVAILGVSRSKMQPIWNGSEFEPRLMLPLDLSYDHRVIDGAEAARFLVAMTQYLGDIRRLLL